LHYILRTDKVNIMLTVWTYQTVSLPIFKYLIIVSTLIFLESFKILLVIQIYIVHKIILWTVNSIKESVITPLRGIHYNWLIPIGGSLSISKPYILLCVLRIMQWLTKSLLIEFINRIINLKICFFKIQLFIIGQAVIVVLSFVFFE
jgi:hypothetical protein